MPAVVHHQAAKQITGVVVSAGKMMKTVKVQVPKQKWNKRIQKYYATPYNVLVSDPTESAREGDVVSIQAGYRTSKHVHHVIADIIAPMGPPLSQRPHLMTEAERIAALVAKREARDEQQAANGRLVAIRRVKERRQIEEVLSKLESKLDHEEKQELIAKAKSIIATRKSAKEQEAEEYDGKREEVIQAKSDEYQDMVAKLKALAEAQESAGETEKKELALQVEALVDARRAANAERQTDLYFAKALPIVFSKTLKYWGKDYADPSFRHNEHPPTAKQKNSYSDMVRNRMEEFFKPSEEAKDTAHLKRYPNIIKLQDELDEYYNEAKEAREQQKSFLHLYLKIAQARVQIAEEILSILATDFNQIADRDTSTTVDLRHMGDEDVTKAIKIAADEELPRRKAKLERLEEYIVTVRGNEVEYATNSAKWNTLVIELGLSQNMKSLAASELATVPGVEQFGAHVMKWKIERRREVLAARRAASKAAAKQRNAEADVESVPVVEAVAPAPETTAPPTSSKAEEVAGVEEKSGEKSQDEKKGLRGWLGL